MAPTRRRDAALIDVMGIESRLGRATRAPQVVRVNDLDAEVSHSEWLGGGATIAVVAKEAPGGTCSLLCRVTAARLA